MRGYNIVTVTQGDGSSTEYRFFRGMDGDRENVSGGRHTEYVARSDGTQLLDSNWLRGKVYEVRTFAPGGTLLARQTTDYFVTPTAGSGDEGAYFVAPSVVRTWSYNAAGTPVKETEIRYTYDSYGNVTQELHGGDVSTSSDDRLIVREFFYNTTNYIVDRPKWERIFAGNTRTADGTEKAMEAYAYDGLAFFSGTPTKGNQTRIAAYHTISSDYTNSAYYDVTTTQYDSLGRPTVATDANNQSTTTSYHPVYGYAQRVTNALGHTTETVIDPGTGNELTVTDPNGAVTAHEYDLFGRLVKTWRPGETQGTDAATLEVSYTLGSSGVPSRVHVRQREDLGGASAASFLESWRFFDGLGRLIQTQAEAASGSEVIVANREYDAVGRLKRESVPYTVAATPGTYRTPDWTQRQTQYSYDGLGRQIQVTNPDATTVTTQYDGWTQTVIDEKSHQRVFDRDAFGQVVQVREYTGANPYTLYATTVYGYNILGNLTQVTDTAGKVTTLTYDPLGRKTTMSDPNMGTWHYRYDGVGNLTKQRDARNQAICFYYDALHRLEARSYHSNISNLDSLTCPGAPYVSYAVSYSYDTGTNGIGRRAGMSDGSGSTSWDYDARGRVTAETKIINGTGGGTFLTQWSYDALDRQRTMTYPGGNAGQSGEVVTFSYSTQGLLQRVAGTSVYADDIQYNAREQVELLVLGNGLRTDYGYRSDNFRLDTLKTGTAGTPTSLQHLSYLYDAGGNVTQITDYNAGGTQTQTFGYDDLDRLTSAAASGGTGGIYSASYSYHPNGTINTFEGLTYSYNDPTHPQAVTTISNGNSFVYDANGNTTSRTIGGVVYTLTYDEENRVASFSGGVSSNATFSYDGDGQRVKRVATSSGTVTIYVRDSYEQTGTTVTKYYYAGERRIALRQNDGTPIFLHSDHLGSTAVTTNNSGGKVSELRYKPYGWLRYWWGATPTDRRFTGQVFDGVTGLYFYQARYYDALLGRFVSPDTLVPDPNTPQDLNRYSYGLNNPLRYTDPTGHAVCEDDACTRVVHPISGKLIRRSPPRINWQSIPLVVRFIYKFMITQAKGATVAQLRSWNHQCLSCKAPSIPSVQSAAAFSDAEARVLAFSLFAWKVRQGGEWDPKPKLVREFGDVRSTYWNQLREDGPEYYYDVWGNIVYGYLGTTATFSEGTLLEGAGAEQFGSSIGYAIRRRDPGLLPKRTPGVEGLRAWDDPADQAGIRIGVDLWNTYNLTVTPLDIIEAIDRTPGLTTYLPPK